MRQIWSSLVIFVLIAIGCRATIVPAVKTAQDSDYGVFSIEAFGQRGPHQVFERKVYRLIAQPAFPVESSWDEALGSAVVVRTGRNELYCLTAAHVVNQDRYSQRVLERQRVSDESHCRLVRSPDQIGEIVILDDHGRSFRCSIIAIMASLDVAVLAISDSQSIDPTTVIERVAFDNVVEGEPLIVCGFSAGRRRSFQTVVGKEQVFLHDIGDIGSLTNLVRIPVSTAPGYSGGPVFRSNGELLGLCSCLYGGRQMLPHAFFSSPASVREVLKRRH